MKALRTGLVLSLLFFFVYGVSAPPAPPVTATPAQVSGLILMQQRFLFDPWATGVLEKNDEVGPPTPIECGNRALQDACDDDQGDCEFYGNDPGPPPAGEDNLVDLTDDVLLTTWTALINPEVIAGFTSENYVYLDWKSDSRTILDCDWDPNDLGGNCPNDGDCTDIDSCIGPVMWIGRLKVEYVYCYEPVGGVTPCTPDPMIPVEFQRSLNPQGCPNWGVSPKRHSPPDETVATWNNCQARVLGADPNRELVEVRLYRDQWKGYTVAGFKNWNKDCEVIVSIPNWWIDWSLRFASNLCELCQGI